MKVLGATLALLVPALVGARLSYVATSWRAYRSDVSRIWHRAEGGAALLGGLPLSLLASLPLLTLLGLPFGAFWDVTAFAILPALVVGRLGCTSMAAAPAARPLAPVALSCPTPAACGGDEFPPSSRCRGRSPAMRADNRTFRSVFAVQGIAPREVV